MFVIEMLRNLMIGLWLDIYPTRRRAVSHLQWRRGGIAIVGSTPHMRVLAIP